jgi:hypothetical protein
VVLACSILGSQIGGEANKLSSNISIEDVDIKEVYLFFGFICLFGFFLCAVAQSFLRQNLNLRM